MRLDGYLPIARYGVIGDARTAALVGADGGIDWACLPRFDSPSIFGRLLDARHGGHFTVRPAGPFRVERRYAGPTNVLQTTFHTPEGAVRLTDLMPARREADKRRALLPHHEILRRVEGLEGRVAVQAVYQPRPGYGARGCRLRRLGPHVVAGSVGAAAFHLVTDFPLEVREDLAAGQAVLTPGRRHDFRFTFAEGEPAVVPPLGPVVDQEIRATQAFWQAWAEACRYRGPYREAVVRSVLALKLLTYAPSGAIVAAPTTSLPERIGGVRNWDYRYCWLRDAAFTVRALFALGYLAEGEAFVQWLLHATRLTHPRLQVVYSVHGEADLPEETLDYLEGYRGSRPVRTGNGAHRQFQLDVYGEVLDALHLYRRIGGSLDRDTLALVGGMADYVRGHWDLPDDGIWEVRAGRAHHVHSKVLCWTALDRAAALLQEKRPADADGWRRAAEGIARTVHERGFNPALGSFTARLDGETVDAALLVLPRTGFIPGHDPRMQGTIDAVRSRLGRDGLLYRYPPETDDGLPGGEGAFGICSFWLVEALALAGRVDEAHQAFRRMLDRANDLGLYAEELDPDTGEFLGNFPQAFTHIGLINAALTLAEVEDGQASW